MQKIDLALEPEVERHKEKPNVVSVVVKEDQYNQEQEKFLNERWRDENVGESALVRTQRLQPQCDFRKLVL